MARRALEMRNGIDASESLALAALEFLDGLIETLRELKEVRLTLGNWRLERELEGRLTFVKGPARILLLELQSKCFGVSRLILCRFPQSLVEPVLVGILGKTTEPDLEKKKRIFGFGASRVSLSLVLLGIQFIQSFLLTPNSKGGR